MADHAPPSASAGSAPDSRLCERSSSSRLGSANSDRGMAPVSPIPRRCRCVSRVNFASVASEGNEKEKASAFSDSCIETFSESFIETVSTNSSRSTNSPSLSSRRLVHSPTDSGIAPASALPLRSIRRVYRPQIPEDGRFPRNALARKSIVLTLLLGLAIQPPSPASESNAFVDASKKVS